MEMHRRSVLRFTGAAAVTGLAGCSTLATSQPNLDLTVENYRTESVELLIEVLSPDSSDRSEAIVYRESVDIPSESVGNDRWRVTNIAPAQPYRIEVTSELESGLKTHHYHYIPDCTGGDAPYEPRVNFILNEHPGIAFSQTNCADDVASAP